MPVAWKLALPVFLLTWPWAGAAQAGAGPTAPLEDNRRITAAYIHLAQGFQALLDPDFQAGGVSSVRPNWFGFALHSSHEVGKGLLGTALARRILAAGRGEPSLSALQALERVGLSGSARVSAEGLAVALEVQGLPADAAASLGALATSMNGKALGDPRTLGLTALRLAALYWKAPRLLPLDRAEAVVETLERILHEGNLAIFADLGGVAEQYLGWRGAVGEVTAGQVLEHFALPGARPEEARHAYAYALAHAEDTPRPAVMDQLLPEVTGQSLMVAGFALYEEARRAPTAARRDALIAVANNYLAWHEQLEVVQPTFTPLAARADEVSRPALMEAMTPLLLVHFGTQEWTLAGYAYGQEDRDGSALTSQPTEYGWAAFWDRWPPILDSFELGYREPTALWVMPEPL